MVNFYSFVCKECNKTFKSQFKNRKFCGVSCSSTFINKNRQLNKHRFFHCFVCNKKIRLVLSEITKLKKRKLKRHFCSKKCMGIGFRNDKRPNTSKSLILAYKEQRIKPNRFRVGGFREDLGCYFRSNWEANFARILNYDGFNWLYEPEVFLLKINNKETTYRPDFYVPEKDTWYEIKGYWANSLAKKKFYEFRKNHKIILIDLSAYKMLEYKYRDKIKWEGKKYV